MANDLSPVFPGQLITAELINKIIQRLQGGTDATSGVPVPSLFGFTLGQATNLLASPGSSVQLGGVLDVFGTTIAPKDPAKIGLMVVGQSPSWGVLVPAGTGINLVIAAAVSSAPSKVPSITGFNPTSQNVGLTLEIIGANFDTTFSNNVVTIGGILAAVQVNNSSNSAQNLFVTVPDGADKVAQPASVVVTTPSGGPGKASTATILASTGVQPPTITSFSGTAVQTAGSLSLVNTGNTTGVDITVSGAGFGTDPSRVQMFLGNPSTPGIPMLTPTTASAVTPTAMTIHVPPSSTIPAGSARSTPVLVVNGVQGPPSAITLQISL